VKYNSFLNYSGLFQERTVSPFQNRFEMIASEMVVETVATAQDGPKNSRIETQGSSPCSFKGLSAGRSPKPLQDLGSFPGTLRRGRVEPLLNDRDSDLDLRVKRGQIKNGYDCFQTRVRETDAPESSRLHEMDSQGFEG
jgi:hypothetical protein